MSRRIAILSLAASAPLERFQLVQRSRPVGAEQARQAAICQDFPASLASRAVVGLVVGVADAQDFFTASWTRLAIPPVNGPAFPKSRYLFGECGSGFPLQTIDPELERLLRRGIETFPFFRLEFAGLGDR